MWNQNAPETYPWPSVEDRDDDFGRTLPDPDEEWNELWWFATLTREELRFLYRMTPPRDTPRAAL